MKQNRKINLFKLFEAHPDFIIKYNSNRTFLLSTRFRKHLTFPTNISLSEGLFKALYIVFGDGHYKSKLNLTNKNYRIHNFVLEVFKRELKFDKNIWRLRILHHQAENEELMNLIKSYWLSVLKFNQNQLYPKLSPEKFNTSIQGIARIQIDKLTYADVIDRLIEYVNMLIFTGNLSKKEYCIIADAILNAEGSVSKEYDGIHKITISFNKSEKGLFKKIFTELISEKGLKDRDDRFIINKWINIYEFLKTFVEFNIIPFSLRPKDAFKLVSGFLNHKRTKALRNYLETTQKNPEKPFSKIAELSKRHHKSAKLTLQIRTKEFIQIKKYKNKHLTSISEEGKNLLALIMKLENWLPILEKMIEEDKLLFKQLKEVN